MRKSFNRIPGRGLAFLLSALIALFSSAAHAQFGDLVRAARDAATVARQAGSAVSDVSTVMRSVKSISQASTVPKSQGAELPPDAGDGKVVLYTTQSCGYCKAAMKHVREKGIPHVEKDVQANQGYAEEFVRMKARGVPQILFGTTLMNGFEASQFDRNYASWKSATAPAPQQATAASSPSPTVAAEAPAAGQHGDAVKPGDALVIKIKGVRLASAPNATATANQPLEKGEEVVYLGEDRDGFAKVSSARGDGWVNRALLRKP